jgi:hypothetical protein
MAKERTCRSCTACCTYLRTESQPGYTTRYDTGEDIAKPAGISCRFLTDQGCGIYEARPQVCRKFRCDWLQGRKGFDMKDAPDLKGSFSVNGNRFHIAPPSPTTIPLMS